MRILHVIDSLGPGGKERQLVELLKGFSRRGGYEMHVVVLDDGVHYGDIHGLDSVKIYKLVRRYRKDPFVLRGLIRVCRSFRPDILMAWDSMTAIYAMSASMLLGIKFVNAMIQNAPDGLSWKLWTRSRLSFPFSDVILSNSHAGLDAYGVRSRKAAVIHNGYDMARAERGAPGAAEVRRRLGLRESPIVGMVAGFRPTKDQGTLIRAARLVREKRPETIFVLGGDGETLDACRRAVDPRDSDHVVFPGRLREDVESVVAAFDVSVLATYTEGISNSIMEYMVMGKPVVATDCKGNRELVVDSVTGFLVKRGDPGEMAERIARLIDDGALRKAMGDAGRRRIEEEFSLERMVSRHESLFRSVLDGQVATRSKA